MVLLQSIFIRMGWGGGEDVQIFAIMYFVFLIVFVRFGEREGGDGGGCAVLEAATPALDGTAPLLCFFRLFHGIAHGSRMLRTLKRGMKTLSLNVGYEDPIW